MRDYKKYEIWNVGKDVTLIVYEITNNFPKSEQFGLISQIRRSAVSIPSNIAEGSARETEKEFKRFLSISLGSIFEQETQLLISFELDYLKNNDFQNLMEKLNLLKMKTISLMKKLKA